MYKVLRFFTDLQDGNHEYHAGDSFPREGVDVSEARLAELAGANNKQSVALIEEIAAESAELASDAENDVEEKESTTEQEKPPKKAKKG